MGCRRVGISKYVAGMSRAARVCPSARQDCSSEDSSDMPPVLAIQSSTNASAAGVGAQYMVPTCQVRGRWAGIRRAWKSQPGSRKYSGFWRMLPSTSIHS